MQLPGRSAFFGMPSRNTHPERLFGRLLKNSLAVERRSLTTSSLWSTAVREACERTFTTWTTTGLRSVNRVAARRPLVPLHPQMTISSRPICHHAPTLMSTIGLPVARRSRMGPLECRGRHRLDVRASLLHPSSSLAPPSRWRPHRIHMAAPPNTRVIRSREVDKVFSPCKAHWSFHAISAEGGT